MCVITIFGKIKLDPYGTVGVMEDNAVYLPERDRNHTIYSTQHVVKIPGYKFDYMDQYQNIVSAAGESGFSKAMSAESKNVITGFGEGAVENAQISDLKANESFSETF